MIVSARMFGVEAGRVSWRPACVLALLAASLAGCAQAPSQYARHGHEYFSTVNTAPRASASSRTDNQCRMAGDISRRPPLHDRRAHLLSPRGDKLQRRRHGVPDGDAFHGRRTANGEIYDMSSFTAAHPTMPLPSYARITIFAQRLFDHRFRVTHRGPYHGGCVRPCRRASPTCSISRTRARRRLKLTTSAPLRIEGSDDSTLLASI